MLINIAIGYVIKTSTIDFRHTDLIDDFQIALTAFINISNFDECMDIICKNLDLDDAYKFKSWASLGVIGK